MAKLTAAAVFGFVVGVIGGAALGIRAQGAAQEDDDTAALAAEAGVSETDLAGALAVQPGVSGRQYLTFLGLATPLGVHPPDAAVAGGRLASVAGSDWPISGALGQRIFCIEGIESRHGAAMWNPQPIWNGEHAQGFLGFIPSTARHWGAIIGNRASEWTAAARMLQAGAGRQFAGVAWGQC